MSEESQRCIWSSLLQHGKHRSHIVCNFALLSGASGGVEDGTQAFIHGMQVLLEMLNSGLHTGK